MDSLTLKDILDLGLQGILLVFVYALWQRLNAVTDRWFDYQEKADAEREVLATLSGIPAMDFHREASYVRERRKRLENGDTGTRTGQEETH